jgi:hypothetical protein
MSASLIPTIDELKAELQEKAPAYYTDDRLAPMTFSDCVFARSEVNKQLANDVASPFKPGKIKKPKPKPRNEEERPEYTRDPRFGIVTEEELAVAKAADEAGPTNEINIGKKDK